MNKNTPFEFSSENRNRFISENENVFCDLVVIGGGITGAGIALDSASRGLTSVLIEMNDFSSGTSSRSTKLIHGGLRYLKQLELGLVRTVGKERAILHRNCPHLVVPQKMLLPVYKSGTYRMFTLRLALWCYDILAGVKREERKIILDREKTIAAEPSLDKNGLLGSALYFEYNTNDSRLTIEILKKSAQFGAIPLNYLKQERFIYKENIISGVVARDRFSGKEIYIHAKTVVNATGPWVDETRKKDSAVTGKHLFITKGVHLTLHRNKIPVKHSVYVNAIDGRMIFIIPKGDKVYVGTTDTPYSENMENPKVVHEDAKYLIDSINNVFPESKISASDIISSWAGLRPLIFESNKAPSEMSRKDEIFTSPSGLISIAGGKLTGYRVMAKKIVDRFLGKEKRGCITHTIKLCGANFSPEKMIEFADHKFDEAKQTGISPEEFKRLFYRYGSEVEIITEKAFEIFALKRDTKKAWQMAEIWFCVHYEMVLTLSDFLIRRTELLHLDRERISSRIDSIADDLAEILNWSQSDKEENINGFMKSYYEAVDFKNLTL